jgi:hypothetical protein
MSELLELFRVLLAVFLIGIVTGWLLKGIWS